MSILDGATLAQVPWGSDNIQVIGLAPGTRLFRVFRHDNMDWEAPPELYRTGRLDPPDGHKSEFATLYTAESLLTGAFETRALRMEAGPSGDSVVANFDVDPTLPPRRFVEHSLAKGALFVDLEDRGTARLFGLDPDALLDRISMWQKASKAVCDRLVADPPTTVAPLVGVAHQSKIRGSNGWNFGFYIPRHVDVLKRGTPELLNLRDLAHGHGFDLP